jgi:Fur family ferric uptake transcriptional regulator
MKFNFKFGDVMKKINYNTKQKAIILDYIKNAGDKHFTVDSLCEKMLKNGDAVGRTTVYRFAEALANDGLLRKYAATHGQSVCYQYVGEHSDCNNHFHLKCEKCGSLIHLECDEMSELAQHIENHHGFSLNPLKTGIYGVCEACAVK